MFLVVGVAVQDPKGEIWATVHLFANKSLVKSRKTNWNGVGLSLFCVQSFVIPESFGSRDSRMASDVGSSFVREKKVEKEISFMS